MTGDFINSGPGLPARSRPERYYWIGLAVACAAMAVVSHWPVRHGYFGIDDFLYLSLAHWRSVAVSFFGTQGAHDVYRPIFRLSIYLDALLLHRNAGAMHIENVLIHAANALLLAAVLRAYRLPPDVCGAAAILFLFSPLSGECVDWISGRTASLCFLFMLVALWRWTLAVAGRRPPWAAAVWLVVSAMTYEAGVALPVVLVCLAPIARKRLGLTWQELFRRIAPMIAVTAAFVVMRAIFLGTFVGYTNTATSPYLWQNFVNQLDVLKAVYGIFGSVTSVWILAAALVVTTAVPAFFPVGPCLVLCAVTLLLPYLYAAGAGERFYYMLQAPFCVMAVLPAMILGRRLRPLALAVLLIAVVPAFIPWIWREAVQFTIAGQKTKALVDAVHAAIPANDPAGNIIDGVPDFIDSRPMMGGYFEAGIADSYPAPPPLVMRSQAVFADSAQLADLARHAPRFWRYDLDARRLEPMSREAWLALYPEMRAVLPQ